MRLRQQVLAVALISTFSLAGCDRLSPDTARSSTPTALSMDTPIRGEMTSSSAINYNDGSRYQRFTLALEDDEAVDVQFEGTFDGRLTLLHEGQLIAGAMAQGPDGHMHSAESPEGLKMLSFPFRAPASGTYTLAVSGQSANAYGPFTIVARSITPHDGSPLTAGNQFTDWLVNSDQTYSIEIPQAGLYAIDLSANSFDTVLQLSGNGVDVQNDDANNSTDSQLLLYLEPGTYTATVSALDGRLGAFRLALAERPLSANTIYHDDTVLPHNQRVEALTDSNGQRRFNFVLEQASKVVFDARSNDVDTVLEVDGNGVAASDDDSGDGTNSRLELNLRPGTYTVAVRSLGGNVGSISIQASPVAP